MKKLIPIGLLLVGLFFAYAFINRTATPTSTEVEPEVAPAVELSTTADGLRWYTWEEAAAAMQKNPKKIVVDVYTEWCGWCKVMDKKTFSEPKVSAYLSEHFYPVKLDAEQRESITFDGNTFEFRQDMGRRGVHTLAYSLLEGRMSYPSLVYLNERFERIMTSPGYKTPEQFMPELKFAAEEHYQQQTFDEFRNAN